MVQGVGLCEWPGFPRRGFHLPGAFGTVREHTADGQGMLLVRLGNIQGGIHFQGNKYLPLVHCLQALAGDCLDQAAQQAKAQVAVGKVPAGCAPGSAWHPRESRRRYLPGQKRLRRRACHAGRNGGKAPVPPWLRVGDALPATPWADGQRYGLPGAAGPSPPNAARTRR